MFYDLPTQSQVDDAIKSHKDNIEKIESILAERRAMDELNDESETSTNTMFESVSARDTALDAFFSTHFANDSLAQDVIGAIQNNLSIASQNMEIRERIKAQSAIIEQRFRDECQAQIEHSELAISELSSMPTRPDDEPAPIILN